MKRIFVMMSIIFLYSAHISAMDKYYHELRRKIISVGVKIEQVDNVPVIGKLTALLPFALLASSLKEYPIQTVAVITAVCCYIISQSESVRAKLDEYKFTKRFPWIKKDPIESALDDEDLFVFDIEDEYTDEYVDENELYIEEELDAEEELYAIENELYDENEFYIEDELREDEYFDENDRENGYWIDEYAL